MRRLLFTSFFTGFFTSFFTSLGVLACLCARDAQATYSIAAVDSDEMLVGGAGTSCVGSLNVSIIQGTVPGIGVVHAQAAINEAGRDEAVALLSMGASASEVINAIANSGFDFGFEQRQYGVVRLPEDAFAFTGSQNMPVASHQYGTVGPHRYSVQGNILTSENVLTQTADGFETPDACDMAERLMLALEAGAENGEGDSRCTDDGIPSDSAFIRIVSSSGEELIFIEAVDTFPENPMVPLREFYEVWREENPCPDKPGGADEEGEGEASTDATADGTADGETTADPGSEGTSSEGDVSGEITDSGSGSVGTGETGIDQAEGEAYSPGCSCTGDSDGGSGPAAWMLLLLAGVFRGRAIAPPTPRG